MSSISPSQSRNPSPYRDDYYKQRDKRPSVGSEDRFSHGPLSSRARDRYRHTLYERPHECSEVRSSSPHHSRYETQEMSLSDEMNRKTECATVFKEDKLYSKNQRYLINSLDEINTFINNRLDQIEFGETKDFLTAKDELRESKLYEYIMCRLYSLCELKKTNQLNKDFLIEEKEEFDSIGIEIKCPIISGVENNFYSIIDYFIGNLSLKEPCHPHFDNVILNLKKSQQRCSEHFTLEKLERYLEIQLIIWRTNKINSTITDRLNYIKSKYSNNEQIILKTIDLSALKIHKWLLLSLSILMLSIFFEPQSDSQIEEVDKFYNSFLEKIRAYLELHGETVTQDRGSQTSDRLYKIKRNFYKIKPYLKPYLKEVTSFLKSKDISKNVAEKQKTALRAMIEYSFTVAMDCKSIIYRFFKIPTLAKNLDEMIAFIDERCKQGEFLDKEDASPQNVDLKELEFYCHILLYLDCFLFKEKEFSDVEIKKELGEKKSQLLEEIERSEKYESSEKRIIRDYIFIIESYFLDIVKAYSSRDDSENTILIQTSREPSATEVKNIHSKVLDFKERYYSLYECMINRLSEIQKNDFLCIISKTIRIKNIINRWLEEKSCEKKDSALKDIDKMILDSYDSLVKILPFALQLVCIENDPQEKAAINKVTVQFEKDIEKIILFQGTQSRSQLIDDLGDVQKQLQCIASSVKSSWPFIRIEKERKEELDKELGEELGDFRKMMKKISPLPKAEVISENTTCVALESL